MLFTKKEIKSNPYSNDLKRKDEDNEESLINELSFQMELDLKNNESSTKTKEKSSNSLKHKNADSQLGNFNFKHINSSNSDSHQTINNLGKYFLN